MDKVRITGNGGISALSAFFSGFGASIALNLPMETTMSITGKKDKSVGGAVEKTISILKRKFDVSDQFTVKFGRVIPPGRGLKSSSVLVLSLVSGFLSLEGISLSDDDLLDLCAEVSIKNGTSSTGAYDDLASSLYGGVCLTDNKARKLISRKPVAEDHVVLAYGQGRRSSRTVKLEEMSRFEKHAGVIKQLVEEERYYEAMSFNGALLATIFGQNSRLIRTLLSSGAKYSSQCGKGPAVFGVFESSREAKHAAERIRKESQAHVKKTLFSNSSLNIERL